MLITLAICIGRSIDLRGFAMAMTELLVRLRLLVAVVSIYVRAGCVAVVRRGLFLRRWLSLSRSCYAVR